MRAMQFPRKALGGRRFDGVDAVVEPRQKAHVLGIEGAI